MKMWTSSKGGGKQQEQKRAHFRRYPCLRWIPERSQITLKSGEEQLKVVKEKKTFSVEEGYTYACRLQWATASHQESGILFHPHPPLAPRGGMKNIIELTRWAGLDFPGLSLSAVPLPPS